MTLGAFIAGLMLAETEYRRAIEAVIEPFKGLLLGLLMSLGHGWLYLTLWLWPLMTGYQLVSRLRNIAEHAVDHAEHFQHHSYTLLSMRLQVPNVVQ